MGVDLIRDSAVCMLGFAFWIPGFGLLGPGARILGFDSCLGAWTWRPGFAVMGLGSWAWIPGFGLLAWADCQKCLKL